MDKGPPALMMSRGGWPWLRRAMMVAGLMALVMMPDGGALAATHGFTLSPAMTELPITASQKTVPLELTLTNNASVEQSFHISVVDFGSLDEQGGVAFLGAAAGELDHKYGLASWMTPDQADVTVPAGGVHKIIVTVDNRESLAPGGHYGAVLATGVTQGGGANDPHVGVKQVLSSLVLVTKAGGTDNNLNLVSQTTNAGWWELPTLVRLRFHNQGNVHVVPRGVTEIRDMGGRVVARGAMNAESGAILPDSYRRYESPIILVSKAWMPGRYQIVTTYRIDGTEATKRFVTTFWYSGAVFVLLVMTLAVVAGMLLSWWLWRRNRQA